MSNVNYKRKIVSTEEVAKCPICNSANQQKLYNDFEGSSLVRCSECELTFQNPRHEISYEKEYWGKAIDPDGNERNLVSERDSKT